MARPRTPERPIHLRSALFSTAGDLKAAWQKNGRDGGRIRKDALFAGQVLYWF